FRIKLEHLRLDGLSHLEHILWVVDSFLRANIADVYEAFNSLGDLYKGPEFCKAHDGPFDHGAERKSLCGIGPRIAHCLFNPQRNLLLARIDREDHRLYGFSRFNQIAGFVDSFDPRHLGNMNESFNPRLQFDKCSEIGDASDGATYAIASLISVED